MIDRWVNRGGNELKEGEDFLLHRMISAYTGRQGSPEQLTPLEASIARLFDLRMMLDFSIDDLVLPPLETTSLGHRALKAILQYASLEIDRFGTVCEAFYGQLSQSQRHSLSHLDPVAKEIARLASSASGVRESAERGNGGHGAGRIHARAARQDGRDPGHDLLVCASTVITFVDGAMHAMQAEFHTALAKAAAGEPEFAPEDTEIPHGPGHGESSQKIHCVDFEGLDSTAVLLVPTIMRLHGGLYRSISMHNHLHEILSKKHKATEVWNQIHRHKIVFYLRQIVVDICAFLEMYPSIRQGSDAGADDGVVASLMGHGGAILELRDSMMSAGTSRSFESFSGMLSRGIGHGRLVVLACGILEWLRVNAVHYQTMCPGCPPIPDLPEPEHRLDLEAALFEVGITRARAQNALELREREACTAVQA